MSYHRRYRANMILRLCEPKPNATANAKTLFRTGCGNVTHENNTINVLNIYKIF